MAHALERNPCRPGNSYLNPGAHLRNILRASTGREEPSLGSQLEAACLSFDGSRVLDRGGVWLRKCARVLRPLTAWDGRLRAGERRLRSWPRWPALRRRPVAATAVATRLVMPAAPVGPALRAIRAVRAPHAILAAA